MSLIQNVGNGWQPILEAEYAKPYFERLSHSIAAAETRGLEIYPARDKIYRALELTPLEDVKVVILGQDPYHAPGQAQGLAFSVGVGAPIPSSLRNIQAEIHRSLKVEQPSHGCLDSWARQGVLLLNSVLTVERGRANAHKGLGWERLTDALIAAVADGPEPVVFMLWGSVAQAKAVDVARNGIGARHCLLQTSHPSGLSAHKGFRG
ncbi:hypothetical protein LTR94_026469, partial [Friedmanniomyces endolithicus]